MVAWSEDAKWHEETQFKQQNLSKLVETQQTAYKSAYKYKHNLH